VPPRDATVVSRLRQAGAVVLGKTNMDEFGMGSSTENSAEGATRNPWDPERVPGGSSGGSAVAVAAGMAPLALGSDTGGSVRQPAALCGVVGVKPTYGRVSRSGLVAFGSSLDQVGPLASSVAGAAMLLETISGFDAADMTTSQTAVGSYRDACRLGVEGLRIGLPREYFGEGLDAEIESGLREAVTRLAERGARIEEISLPHSRFAIPTYYLVATAEASSNLARFDAVRFGNRVDPAAGCDAMYLASRGRHLGREAKRRIMLGTFALSAGYHEAFYGKAQRARRLLRADFSDNFDAGIDAILCPTTPTPAFKLGQKLDNPLSMYLSDIYTASASLAGVPAMSVPIGTTRAGLPIGAQLIAAHFDEEMLFRVGAVLELAYPPSSAPGLYRTPRSRDPRET
jgi:aspartyl-tRNA(Asn)/glutamyl-tRNA(Gln) amidotransferase subunit A